MRRCPWSIVKKPDVSTALQWWQDWERFKLLPCGSSNIADEPHPVYESLSLCEDTKAEVQRKQHETQQKELERQRKKAEAKRGGRY